MVKGEEMQAAVDRKIYKGIDKEREGSVRAWGEEMRVLKSQENRADIFKRLQTGDKRIAGSDIRNLWQCVPIYHFLLPTPANNAAVSSFRNILCHMVCFSGHEAGIILLTDMKSVYFLPRWTADTSELRIDE